MMLLQIYYLLLLRSPLLTNIKWLQFIIVKILERLYNLQQQPKPMSK